jgi:hypothetical protein
MMFIYRPLGEDQEDNDKNKSDASWSLVRSNGTLRPSPEGEEQEKRHGNQQNGAEHGIIS